MKYVVPNISQFQAKEITPQVMGGAYGTQAFWWTEEDTYPLAKFFVDAFQKKNNYKPDWGASEVYVQLMVWADAVTRAGSFYPIDVIKALESGQKVPSIYGDVYYRAGDHQLVRPVPVMVGKKPSEMKSPDDYFRIVDLVPGNRCCRRSTRPPARCRTSTPETLPSPKGDGSRQQRRAGKGQPLTAPPRLAALTAPSPCRGG